MRAAAEVMEERSRRDAVTWARELGISREAVELYLASDVIDLHIDSFQGGAHSGL
ncbi:MAG: hypothetical protein SFX73_37035 [Kofleriaceae bacterium]|nr:hypothetical protein [Kofleriaceae bacterium]